jgi:hypothetical protein
MLQDQLQYKDKQIDLLESQIKELKLEELEKEESKLCNSYL